MTTSTPHPPGPPATTPTGIDIGTSTSTCKGAVRP